MNTKIKPLTAEQAKFVLYGDDNLSREESVRRAVEVIDPALKAIADEHHVVLEKLTEAEVLKKFEHAWDHFGIGERYHDTKAGWLAAYRDAGLVKP